MTSCNDRDWTNGRDWVSADMSSFDFGWPAVVEAADGDFDHNSREDMAEVWASHYTHIPTGFQAMFVAVTPFFVLCSSYSRLWEKLSDRIRYRLEDAMNLMYRAYEESPLEDDVFAPTNAYPIDNLLGVLVTWTSPVSEKEDTEKLLAIAIDDYLRRKKSVRCIVAATDNKNASIENVLRRVNEKYGIETGNAIYDEEDEDWNLILCKLNRR